jgi:hydrogenase-4 component F
MYGILRYHIIVTKSLGPGFSGTLLLIFGILSLATAAVFIILQKDYKRLLAYSSIEHMGIIAIGFGLGTAAGMFGALLHMLNHALTKCLMFFGAGNVLQKYRTKNIDEVRGIATLMPVTAVLLICGAFAITGSPPFSIFTSEIIILGASMASGNYLVTGLFLFLIVVIFAGFVYHISKMAFGEPAPGTIKGDAPILSLAVMALLLCIILVMGFFMPGELTAAIAKIIGVFGGSI